MLVREAIVLAGGEDTRLHPLTSADNPKCLLPVANVPALLYSLVALQKVVCGEGAAAKVQKHIQKESSVALQGMTVHVVKAASECGSADAVRLVADRLTGQDVVVMSGDTVTNMALTSVLFTHSMQRASMTTVLSRNATSASANTKAGKAPKGVDYVAVDKAGERLLSYSYNPAQLRRISVPARALQACSCMEITTDLRDACIYILHLTVVERIKLSSMSSIKVELLPALVNEQWQAVNLMELADKPLADISLPENVLVSADKDQTAACLQELSPPWSTSRQTDGIYCAAYLVGSEVICRRINTLQSLLEANRELAVDAAGVPRAGIRELVPELVHSTVELGSKAVIAAGCVIGEHSSIGDKSSVKRSIVGATCRIGSNVKILNSVLMDGCSVGDGVHIQNSILAFNVSVGSKAQLRDCNIGPDFAVPENADHRDEALSVL